MAATQKDDPIVSGDGQATFRFFFFRHGYSCVNFYKHKVSKTKYLATYFDPDKTDPHLTNCGIASSMLAGYYVHENQIVPDTFDLEFVSPLIRTWETAACMFPKLRKFMVGPYLRETGVGASDHPESYSKNVERLEKFKEYVIKDKGPIQEIVKEIKPKDNALPPLPPVARQMQNFEINRPCSNMALTCDSNKKRMWYIRKPEYIGPGDLRKFVKFVLKEYFVLVSERTKRLRDNQVVDIVVVCHGGVIKNYFKYLDKALQKSHKKDGRKKTKLYNQNKAFWKANLHNNYGLRVDVPVTYTSTRKIIVYGMIVPHLIFHGIKNPPSDIERSACSLCFGQDVRGFKPCDTVVPRKYRSLSNANQTAPHLKLNKAVGSHTMHPVMSTAKKGIASISANHRTNIEEGLPVGTTQEKKRELAEALAEVNRRYAMGADEEKSRWWCTIL
jgi:broad specificity phosphatase PhoE